MDISRKETVIDYLNKNSVKYERFDHEAVFTIEECQKLKSMKGWDLCKNLLLRTTNGSVHFLLVMRGDKSFVTKEVSRKLGTSRLSFASGEEMEKLLNTSPGSLSILSLIFDKEKAVSLAVDSEILKDEFIYCHACENTTTLKIRTAEILKLIEADGRKIKEIEL